MKNSVYQSLNTIRLIESPTTAAAPVAAKAGSKLLGKVIPVAGAALGAYDAANRLKAGDKTGAAIAGITGAASMIPGIGTGAAILGTGIQAARDKWRTGSWLPDDEQVAAAAAKGQPTQAAAVPAASAQPVPPGGDPKVFALQQQLIAKGAKIKADGKMGPITQAAMKQFPGVQLASKINNPKGKIMSESEKIAALRARLEQIDNPQLNENPLSALAKFGQGIAKGVANPAATNLKNVAAGTTAGAKGIKTGAAVARNPGKVAAAGAAAGAAGMAAMQGGGAAAPQAQASGSPAKPAAGGAAKPAAGGAAKPAAASALTTAEEGEMGVLAQEFDKMMGQDPALDALILQYQKLRPGAADAAP
jgi:peptidoglycan hydrolase-like protein with peptidoglycan-binding domain